MTDQNLVDEALSALMSEPFDKSVTSLIQDPEKREWIRESASLHDPDGFYNLHAIQAPANDKLNVRSSSPSFFVDLDKNSGSRFFAQIVWGRRQQQVCLRTPLVASTLEAYQALLEMIDRIPPEESNVNWIVRLGKDLGGVSPHNPVVVNQNPIGVPQFVFSLNIGKGSLLHVQSSPMLTKGLAYVDAINKAKELIEQHDLEMQWVRRVCSASKGRASTRHITVSFREGGNPDEVACEINCSLPSWTFKVATLPSTSRVFAFEEALIEFVKRFNESPAQNAAPKKKPAAPPKPKPSDVANEKSRLLLKEMLPRALIAWRAEHAWLMKNQANDRQSAVRILQLTRYFVLLDPLRRHEVDYGLRPQIIAELEKDVSLFLARQDSRFSKQKMVDWLRALCGRRFADPGSPLKAGAAFAKEAGLYAETPDKALEILLKEFLIRREANKLLTLSARGANWMEELLTSDMSPYALASSLPPQTAAMLFELKASLETAR